MAADVRHQPAPRLRRHEGVCAVDDRGTSRGFTLVYEPEAWVWHKHRRDMSSLRRQIYAYSKGHIAYHLTTWLRDGDARALSHLFLLMPPWRVWQILRIIARQLRGTNTYSLSMLLVEIAGNLVGPFALWQSRRRVTWEARSAPSMRGWLKEDKLTSVVHDAN